MANIPFPGTDLWQGLSLGSWERVENVGVQRYLRLPARCIRRGLPSYSVNEAGAPGAHLGGGGDETHPSQSSRGWQGRRGDTKKKKRKKKKILAAESETCSHLSSGVNPESLHYNQSISSGPALA